LELWSPDNFYHNEKGERAYIRMGFEKKVSIWVYHDGMGERGGGGEGG